MNSKIFLFLGLTEEDRKASQLLMSFGIPHEALSANHDDTPCLMYGFLECHGLKEIQDFVKCWVKYTELSSC